VIPNPVNILLGLWMKEAQNLIIDTFWLVKKPPS